MNEQEIRADERTRIAGILEDVAAKPTTEPMHRTVFLEVAGVLRIPHDDLVDAALIELCEGIRVDGTPQ